MVKRTVRSRTRIPAAEEGEEPPRRHRRSRSILSREEVGLNLKHPEKQRVKQPYFPWMKPEPRPAVARRRPARVRQHIFVPRPDERTFVVHQDSPTSPPTRPRRSPSPEYLRQQILQSPLDTTCEYNSYIMCDIRRNMRGG